MRVYKLTCEMLVPLAVAEVFSVFEDPYNLARITPPGLGFRVTSKERVQMRAGAQIEYMIRWMGVPMRWKSVITEYEPPFSFVDEQVSGPYRLWRHRHTFRPSAQGTLVGDLVEYALPFGLLGRAANALLVGRRLTQIFAYRQAALSKLLGAAGTPLQDPVIAAN
jgi:ligand-binding SRPBCC domain-containing protein